MVRPSTLSRLRRRAVASLLLAVLAVPIVVPGPTAAVTTPPGAITSSTISSLVTYVAGLAGRLSAADRRRLPTLTSDLAALRSDAARALRTHDDHLAASVKSRLHALSLKITQLPPVARQDEVGVRTEPEMGKPECRDQDLREAFCTHDAWLTTRSPNFVNIRKHAFMDGTLEFPQGVRVNASFVAENDNTVVAGLFSAETYVDDDVAGSNRRLFARALVDGVPAKPGDVVFATTDHQGLRQFLFTAVVKAGIHTVEIQWHVDPGATGAIRDANLLVRTGRSIPSNLGTLTAATPPSGPSLVKTTAVWQDVPGTSVWFWQPQDGVATVTFTAEANVTNSKAIAARALIDNAVILPSDVVFTRGSTFQSRGFTFGKIGLAEGWHLAKVQWFVEQGGKGQFGDRSIAVAAYPSPTAQPSHPFVVAPSGPNYVLPVSGPQPLPGMSTPINISAKGNGEVAVIFSAEVVSTTEATVMLDVDGTIKLDTIATLTDGTIPGQIKSYVLEAKRLTPGPHTLSIQVGGTAGKTQLGDRTMAVMSETGYVPDLAEAPRLTGGRVKSDNTGGIEPLIGPHNVLTILLDPGCSGSTSSDCRTQSEFTPADVTQALYGPGDSVNGFFQNNSGGRFSITNAGVVGWYAADHPYSYYWDDTWKTTGCGYNDSGFSSGHAARVFEAVVHADADFDFAKYDIDKDGEITTHELAIIVVVPQKTPQGSSLAQLLAAQCPGNQRLTADNVFLPRWISGVFTSLDDSDEAYQFTTFAHELMHQWTILDDIYADDHATNPGHMTLMANNRTTSTHLDPIEKLALGWVTPRLVDDDLLLSLTRVEESNRVLVLPRYGAPAQGEEYYVVENRDENAGVGRYDDGIDDSGIAVWHAISDKLDAAKHPIGITQAFWDTTAAATSAADAGNGTMGRWGVRLLRPWENLTGGGVAMFGSSTDRFWDSTEYDLVSGTCPMVFPGPGFVTHNRLAWADCTASGYGIDFQGPAAPTMTIQITKV